MCFWATRRGRSLSIMSASVDSQTLRSLVVSLLWWGSGARRQLVSPYLSLNSYLLTATTRKLILAHELPQLVVSHSLSLLPNKTDGLEPYREFGNNSARSRGQLDKDCRWTSKDGVWVLRTTRQWLPRDLDILKPVLERMRTEGTDFLEKNAALAEQVRRTFVDIDEIEKELKKAAKSIDTAKLLAMMISILSFGPL